MEAGRRRCRLTAADKRPGGKNGGLNVQIRKIDTQNIDARFEQFRAKILANAAFFVANGSVAATLRTYGTRGEGPAFCAVAGKRSRVGNRPGARPRREMSRGRASVRFSFQANANRG